MRSSKNIHTAVLHIALLSLADERVFKSDVWLTMHRNSVWLRKTN